MTRRAQAVIAMALAVAMAAPAVAEARRPEPKPAVDAATAKARKTRHARRLRALVGKKPAEPIGIYNAHTREWLVLDPEQAQAVPEATTSEFFRCHFTNQSTKWDRRLLDVLVGAARHFDRRRIVVISGYRAPKYNLILKKKGRQVSAQSRHTIGSAVDFKLPGVPTKKLLEYVRGRRLGGAGFYPDSGFVHADTGPIRFWSGR